MKFLYAIERAVDRFLGGLGLTIQFCIGLAAFIIIVVYVFPLIEAGVYAVALLGLVCGVALVAALLLWEGWKRLRG